MKNNKEIRPRTTDLLENDLKKFKGCEKPLKRYSKILAYKLKLVIKKYVYSTISFEKTINETLNSKEFMKYREIDDNIRYSITNYIRHTMSDINDSLWHKSLYNEQIDLSEYEKLIEVIKVETTRLQKQEEQVKDTNTFKNISDAELDMYFKGVLSDEFIEVLKKRDFNESLRFIYKDNHKESNIVSNDNSSISGEKEEKTSNIIDFAEYSRRRKK